MDLIIKFLSHPVVAIILLLGVLILAHELGHFIVGKLCGIAVEIFSVGFGPVLLRVRMRDTDYRISAVPLGGFVKFYGATRFEEVPQGIKGKPFHSSPLWARFLTIAAGPFFNFMLAGFTYMAMGMHGIPQLPAVIGEVMDHSPAGRAGLQFGDRILQIDHQPIKNWTDVQQYVSKAARKPLDLVVQRGDKIVAIKVTADSVHDEDDLIGENRGQIGITPGRSPAFVSILKTDGVAARNGMQNGDQIVGVSLGSTHQEKVEFWQQFFMQIREARRLGLDKMVVDIDRGTAFDGKTNSSGSIHKSIELSLADLPGLEVTDLQVENILGIRDSQLTVKSVEQGGAARGAADDEDNVQPVEKSPTAKAVSYQFLKPGDILLQWQGKPLHDLFQYSKLAASFSTPQVNLVIERDGKVFNVLMDLQRIDLQRVEGRVVRYRLPVVFLGEFKQPEFIVEKYGLLGGIKFGYDQTAQQSTVVAKALVGLFTGVVPLKALGGPISIGKVASDSVKLGWMTFLAALAMISINLGLLNLVPIPVLDGGQVVLLIAEGLYRRPLPNSVVESFQKIGFIMVLALVIMATYNDISRFWISMLEGVVGYFQ